MPRNVVVLGSTGSIGRQTLDVAARFPDEVRVVGLGAGRNLGLLREQVARFHPRLVSADVPAHALDRQDVLPASAGMIEMATDPEVDLVVVGTVGAVGLRPTLAALRAGKMVALANKEVLVMAGSLIRDLLGAGCGALVPIDSEHSAIWQCLQGEEKRSVERLTLTASGGALRHLAQEELKRVTPEQALNHPTWAMGPKITVDSATLMNKGLEVLEAAWLFDVGLDRIDIVLHEQSIVHSLVTFDDSSSKAQLGLPDMRLPIQYALSHPQRWLSDYPRLDLAQAGALTFAPLQARRYPLLDLALEAGRMGGTAPTVLCAADEVAVQAFLQGHIRFTDMARIVRDTLDAHTHCPVRELDDILHADAWARGYASRLGHS